MQRLNLVAEEIRKAVFEILDSEFDSEGMECGRIAHCVEMTILAEGSEGSEGSEDCQIPKFEEIKTQVAELAIKETAIRETVERLLKEWEKATEGIEEILFKVSEGSELQIRTGSNDWFRDGQPIHELDYPWESEGIGDLASFLALFPDVLKKAVATTKDRNERLKALIAKYSL